MELNRWIYYGYDKKIFRSCKMKLVLTVLSFSFCILSALPVSSDDDNSPHFLNKFLIKVDKRSIAEDIAQEHGFTIVDELKDLGYVLLKHPEVNHRSKRSADLHIDLLKTDPRVTFAEQQRVLIRDKREIIHDKQIELPERNLAPSEYYRAPEHRSSKSAISGAYVPYNDPYYDDQWYYCNRGQSGGKYHMDLNVEFAWQQGFTGKGVVALVLDDGIQHDHPDLAPNYDAYASADFNDENDDDPTPDITNSGNSHGTRCAGEIAAVANNSNCAVGVAHECKVGGIRLLDGDVTDHLEAKAMIFRLDYIDVCSASWGPRDNGKTMEGPGQATREALRKGVTEGRGGKGIVYVWATGNGGVVGDDCGADGYVSSIETLSIGSVNDKGKAPYFMEKCASTMAVVPSGGEIYAGEYSGKAKIKVVTTDLNGGCTLGFEGTSAAAPLATGCVALTLQANPDLTWRDVQHIVVNTARIPDADRSWVINGAGIHVSHTFGFGTLDCGHMVSLAQNWVNVGEQRRCESEMYDVSEAVPSRGCVSRRVRYPKRCVFGEKTKVDQLEHVQLYMDAEHSRRGDVQIFLTSPKKTESQMLSTRKADTTNEKIKFTFMTVHSWGEEPFGEWEVRMCDNRKTKHDNKGTLNKFQIIWYGTTVTKSKRNANGDAYSPPVDVVQSIAEKEMKDSQSVPIKRHESKSADRLYKNKKMDKKDESSTEKKKNNVLDDLAKILSDRGYDANDVESLFRSSLQTDDKRSGNKESNEDTEKRKFGSENTNAEKEEDKIDDLYDRVFSDLYQSLQEKEEERDEKESRSESYSKWRRNRGHN